jgi:hypothetical protein
MRHEAMMSGRTGRYRLTITVISAERNGGKLGVERRREGTRSGAAALHEDGDTSARRPG